MTAAKAACFYAFLFLLPCYSQRDHALRISLANQTTGTTLMYSKTLNAHALPRDTTSDTKSRFYMMEFYKTHHRVYNE